MDELLAEASCRLSVGRGMVMVGTDVLHVLLCARQKCIS